MKFTTAALEVVSFGTKENMAEVFSSPTSPVGLSSAAVVKNENQRKEKRLSNSDPPGTLEPISSRRYQFRSLVPRSLIDKPLQSLRKDPCELGELRERIPQNPRK